MDQRIVPLGADRGVIMSDRRRLRCMLYLWTPYVAEVLRLENRGGIKKMAREVGSQVICLRSSEGSTRAREWDTISASCQAA